MKLAKIQITNFRCFETLTVPLQLDVNVFVGVNAAGKTTILDAIAIALYDIVAANGGGGKRQRQAQQATLRPSDIHIAPGASDHLSGRKDFVQFRAWATDFYRVTGFTPIAKLDEKPAIEWQDYIQYRPPNDFDYTSNKAEKLEEYFKALWDEARKEPKALIEFPVVAYYRASRRMSGMPPLGDIFKLKLERQEAFKGALDAGESYQSMCQWFYLRENQELRERLRDGGDRDFEYPDLKAARQALVRTLENVKRVFFDDNPPSLKVEFNDECGVKKLMALEQLSDGYRNLMSIVLDFSRRLALAHPNWENPLDGPGILLIDEVELHLHPRWQQTVIPSLRAAFPNTQIIVSTHSPAVLTTVRREHVHLLGTDHKFEQIPTDVGTYGAETSRVLAEVFGTHARPQNIETVEKLRIYLRMVEQKQQGTDDAQRLREEIETALGRSDPDLRRADLRIAQIKFLEKR
jgi:predicted ATP-binding protein involved in virulence